jgi:hypothetical protein
VSDGAVQVGFAASGTFGGPLASVLGAIELTPEVAIAVRAAGFDVATFDTFHWPIGASRFGHGRYLFHESTYDAIFSGHSSADRQAFYVGPILFDKTFARGPQPILISEEQGIVYAIDVVDERYFFSQRRITTARYNVSTDDRTKFYKSSLKNEETEYTPREVLVDLFADIGVPVASYELPTDITELDDVANLRDFDMSGQTVGSIIDAILAACGCVFVAYPSVGHAGFAVRYTVRTIASGAADAKIFLDAFDVDYLGGGMIPPPRDIEDPASTLSLRALGQPPMLDSEVPFAVEVAFPIATEGGSGYSFNDDRETQTNRNFVVDRFHVIAPSLTEATGFPREVTGNEQTFRIVDGKWAIVDVDGVVSNESDLTTRATALASRFYDRYRSGVGNLLYRGILTFGQWSGALDVSYSVNAAGPHTRIRGTFHDPRFGYSRKEKLTPDDIFAIGRVRPIPRPDGRILLDSPGSSVSRYPAILFDSQRHATEARDEFAFHESTIDAATREWIDSADGRDSIVEDNDFAEPATHLASFPSASARRGSPLWVREYSSDEGETFRFVEYVPPFAVRVIKVGGDLGDRNNATTWTYAVVDFHGNLLGDSAVNPIAPESRLATKGPLVQATLGLAGYDEDGKLLLLWTNESLFAEGCS